MNPSAGGGVLVTDGEQRSALAVVRSLGRAGYPVYVCSGRRRSLAGSSRHAVAEATVSDALDSPAPFVADVSRLVEKWQIRTVLPIAEPALLALLAARERIGACIPFPDIAAFRRIADKELVLRAAADLGIAVPEQCVLQSPEQSASLAEAELRFPLVLKPARSVGEADGRLAKLGVRHAAGPRQLRDELDALSPAAYPLLLQQRVVGPGVGVFLLLWEGELLARFAHRRIREKPPSGGVSVYRESIAADPALVRISRALLERLGWWGVAMVEYKLDAATGTPYLMEINGRFWGSLQLAIDAGVDFPALLLYAAEGGAVEPVDRYRLGVRSRWWWGDFDHLLARLRRSRAELSLAPGSAGRWGALRDFFTLWRPGDRSEVLRRDDPRPFLRECAEWVRGR